MEYAASKVLTVATDDIGVLLLFILAGMLLRKVFPPLKKLFLPAGLIGGVLALIVGPQVLGWVKLPDTWSGMATPMINIVVTATIFGSTINKDKLKSFSGAIVLLVLTYFAQMFFGTLTGIGLNSIWKEMPQGWGMMASFTYWGGHGAATTAGTLFEEYGRDGMLSLGIIMATLGLIVAMLAGMVVVNIGARKGWPKYHKMDKSASGVVSDILPEDQRKPIGKGTISADAMAPLAMQLALILASIWLGKLIITNLAKVPYAPAANLFSKFPSLLYGIVGALIIWPIMRKLHIDSLADKASIGSISGVALEICIAAATATLNLKMFAAFIVPILLHMVVIIALMTFICLVLVRRWIKNDWFELALMAYGQGHGSTPSGLALARCVDPESKTEAWEAFGVALGVVTPFTSMFAAIFPLLAIQSVWIPVGLGAAVTVACVLIGELVLRKS